MTSPTADTPGTPPPITVFKALKALWKPALTALTVVAILIGSAYGLGRLQTASEVDEANAIATAARQQTSAAEARALRLEARRQLHLATLRLEERNFGLAQQTLATSSRLLREGKPNEKLKSLAEGMGGYKVPVGEDVSVPLATLRKWVQEFDQAEPVLPAQKPASP